MGKYDIMERIGNLDDFVGWVFIETITKHAAKTTGNGGKIYEAFPGLSEASQSGKVDIRLTIQGVEVDFLDVMDLVYAQYRSAVAVSSRDLAKHYVSKPLKAKIRLLEELLERFEDVVAEEIPDDVLEEIRDWHNPRDGNDSLD